MPFSATINLGTVGVAITSVKLYGCTGTSGGNCTGCTSLTGYENVSVSTFPLLVSGIPNGVTYIQAEALGACSADLVKQCISISGIPGATPAPTSTPTPTPTGTSGPGATNTQTPTATNTPTPTPSTTSGTTPNPTSTQTPTPTATDGDCYTVTYSSVPSDLYVRYRRYSDNTFVTELIQNLETMDNGDGSYTAAICVSTMDGLSNTPICRQGGIDITCDPYIWEKGGSCTSNGTCFLQVDPTPEPTATATLAPEASFTTSNITAFRPGSSAGTTTVTSGTTITVINGTVTIRLKTWVITGYRSDTTLTINGNPYSPSQAGQDGTGEGNGTFVDFNLPIGVYNITSWTVDAITDGPSQTVAQAKIEQI